MQPAPPARIERTRFTLRSWSRLDEQLLGETLRESDAHLRAWTPWVVDGREPGLSLSERLRRHAAAFDAGDEWVYGLFSPAGDEVLGGCGLYPRVGPRGVEIGYWLSVRHVGRGLATAAAEELTRVAFAAVDIDWVEIRCAADNVASGRVPHRLGFRASPVTGEGLIVWRLTRAEFLARDTDASSVP